MVFKKIKQVIKSNLLNNNSANELLSSLLVLNGKIYSKLIKEENISDVKDLEFKVFSQFGDDGIIYFLIQKIFKGNKEFENFIEFGVENYNESNTKFLLTSNNWSGLIIDSCENNINQIKRNSFYWKHDLIAIKSFVTKDNINEIIKDSGFSQKKIGLLSIDIDGNDYWVWEAIEVIEPIIVVIEFNSVFGLEKTVSIPYKENFIRNKEHFSNLYWGASIKGLIYLAKKKGYEFFTTNSAGNNAYFIKKFFFDNISIKFINNIYLAKFRESRDQKGKKSFLGDDQKIKLIENMSVIDVVTKKNFLIKDLY